MIIVWGSIEAKSDCLDEVNRLSLEHVHRSRGESGCISHSVQRDVENPNRCIFFEEWEDMTVLQAHFAVPEFQRFVNSVTGLAVSAPLIRIFESTQIN